MPPPQDTPQEGDVSLADRLDLFKKHHERLASTSDAEGKRRPKHEAILILTCLLAVSYTYPVETLDKNPLIEIPSISLKIPLRDAIAVFPTILATLYLTYLGAALRQTFALVRLLQHDEILRNFEERGTLSRSGRSLPPGAIRYIFLPSPLHPRSGSIPVFVEVSRAIVDFFVSLVFNALPYAATLFITFRASRLLGSYWITTWNFSCIVVMVLAFSSTIVSLSLRR